MDVRIRVRLRKAERLAWDALVGDEGLGTDRPALHLLFGRENPRGVQIEDWLAVAEGKLAARSNDADDPVLALVEEFGCVGHEEGVSCDDEPQRVGETVRASWVVMDARA